MFDFDQTRPSVFPSAERRAEGSHGIEDGPTVRPCAEKKMAATKGSAGCEVMPYATWSLQSFTRSKTVTVSWWGVLLGRGGY